MTTQSTPPGSPSETPQSEPQELYSTANIRFVIFEVGKLTTTVERLVHDVDKLSDKISKLDEKLSDKVSKLDKTVDRFKTGAIVAAAILAIVIPAAGGFGWWVLKDRIESVLNLEKAVRAPPIVVPKSN